MDNQTAKFIAELERERDNLLRSKPHLIALQLQVRQALSKFTDPLVRAEQSYLLLMLQFEDNLTPCLDQLKQIGTPSVKDAA